MKNIPLLIATLGGSLLFLVAIVFGFSKLSNKPVDLSVVMGTAQYVTGDTEAKVTIVEFSDFQCPACQAAQSVLADLMQKHPKDIRLVYRFFPLITIHKNAQASARAAIASASFNKFWEYHDLLFTNQQDWGLEKDPQEKLVQYAVSLGIDKDQFTNKLKDGKSDADAAIAKDVQDGTTLGVQGTPTFFVNGEKSSTGDLTVLVEKALSK